MPKLTQDEPVLVVAGATSALAYVGTQLVAHGVITDTQASSATQAVLPFAVMAVPVLLGLFIRRLVTPARKAAALLEREGLLTDTDLASIETVLAEKLGIDVDLDPDVLTGDDHPDAELVGAPDNQARLADDVEPVGAHRAGGMAAGAEA